MKNPNYLWVLGLRLVFITATECRSEPDPALPDAIDEKSQLFVGGFSLLRPSAAAEPDPALPDAIDEKSQLFVGGAGFKVGFHYCDRVAAAEPDPALPDAIDEKSQLFVGGFHYCDRVPQRSPTQRCQMQLMKNPNYLRCAGFKVVFITCDRVPQRTRPSVARCNLKKIPTICRWVLGLRWVFITATECRSEPDPALPDAIDEKSQLFVGVQV
ncbi:hypothetical protein LSTR_LSTR012379 [Laodelphax striatellus]|uniref:Uncharacterized protein n=1 Tax=Laodelphax striatellus TaxID=195883 RepID=A0A482WNR1_LAOST|nr:hypothetical protein LSTR_LSTR012379 [Laodelphax striatellus]